MKIGVLGAGTWGAALARMLSLDGNEVTVWSAIESEIKQLSEKRIHPNLMGMKIPEEIVITDDIARACEGMEIVVFAVPSVYVRSVAGKAKGYISKDTIIVDVAKGIENDTFKTMTEVIEDELGQGRLVALSGPTHAEEVARDLPTTIVSASRDYDAALTVQNVCIQTPIFSVLKYAAHLKISLPSVRVFLRVSVMVITQRRLSSQEAQPKWQDSVWQWDAIWLPSTDLPVSVTLSLPAQACIQEIIMQVFLSVKDIHPKEPSRKSEWL